MTRLMLLDGNGLIYRGYYALIETPLTTSKGELVNAVFGFTNIVLRAIQDVKPDAVAIAFDLGKPTFRHERYLEYKATRQRMPDELRDQFPKVREVVAALGFPVYEREGFEADDVIATLVGQAEAAGLETTIVTGDLDMLQLVTEQTQAGGLAARRGGQHGRLRPAAHRRALGPSAGPDARLQGAQGRRHRQHPGRARGGGEDRREAGEHVRRRSTRSTSGSTR